MDLELHWVPRRSIGYVLESVAEDQFELVSQNGLDIMELNHTGALIWQLCDDQRTVEEIISLLNDLYPDSASEIPDHVKNTIATLLENGVLYSLM